MRIRHLPDDLLVKVDRAAMSTSPRRLPYLDHRLIDYARSQPSEFQLAMDRPRSYCEMSYIGMPRNW